MDEGQRRGHLRHHGQPVQQTRVRAADPEGRQIYLHVFDWPKDGKLLVPIANQVNKAYVLACAGQELKCEKSAAGQAVLVPSAAPDANASVVVLEIQGSPEVIAGQ